MTRKFVLVIAVSLVFLLAGALLDNRVAGYYQAPLDLYECHRVEETAGTVEIRLATPLSIWGLSFRSGDTSRRAPMAPFVQPQFVSSARQDTNIYNSYRVLDMWQEISFAERKLRSFKLVLTRTPKQILRTEIAWYPTEIRLLTSQPFNWSWRAFVAHLPEHGVLWILAVAWCLWLVSDKSKRPDVTGGG